MAEDEQEPGIAEAYDSSEEEEEKKEDPVEEILISLDHIPNFDSLEREKMDFVALLSELSDRKKGKFLEYVGQELLKQFKLNMPQHGKILFQLAYDAGLDTSILLRPELFLESPREVRSYKELVLKKIRKWIRHRSRSPRIALEPPTFRVKYKTLKALIDRYRNVITAKGKRLEVIEKIRNLSPENQKMFWLKLVRSAFLRLRIGNDEELTIESFRLKDKIWAGLDAGLDPSVLLKAPREATWEHPSRPSFQVGVPLSQEDRLLYKNTFIPMFEQWIDEWREKIRREIGNVMTPHLTVGDSYEQGVTDIIAKYTRPEYKRYKFGRSRRRGGRKISKSRSRSGRKTSKTRKSRSPSRRGSRPRGKKLRKSR